MLNSLQIREDGPNLILIMKTVVAHNFITQAFQNSVDICMPNLVATDPPQWEEVDISIGGVWKILFKVLSDAARRPYILWAPLLMGLYIVTAIGCWLHFTMEI